MAEARLGLALCLRGCDWWRAVPDGQGTDALFALRSDGTVQTAGCAFECAKCGLPYVDTRRVQAEHHRDEQGGA